MPALRLKRNRTKNPQTHPGASSLKDGGGVEPINFLVQTQLVAYFISEGRGGGEAPRGVDLPPIISYHGGGAVLRYFDIFCVHVMCALCEFLPTRGDFARRLLWQSFLWMLSKWSIPKIKLSVYATLNSR